MEDQQLELCPWCHSNDIAIYFWYDHIHQKDRAAGTCLNCWSQGPPGDNEEEATELWNDREQGE